MDETKKRIIVVGSSNTDMVVRTARMPKPGETLLGGVFMMNQGGKGANQAVAAAKLGGDTLFIAKIGDDIFGRETLLLLEKEGIDIRHVSFSAEHASGVALIEVDDTGENSIVVASGANADLSPEDIEAADDEFAGAAVMIVQLETPIETVEKAIETAHAHGVTVVLNPAPAPKTPLRPEILAMVDYIIPNKSEAEAISGVEITDDESMMKAVAEIQRLGVPNVIFTLGSKGALLCTGGKSTLIPSFKVKAVDTTAAGDTFCGALCVGLAEGTSLLEAIEFANKAASITVTRPGAQQAIPYRSEVQ